MFNGSMVAIITPFKNNKIDFDNLEELIEFHIKNGTSAIVPCGTTGESATLSHQEHKDLIAFVVKKVKGRVPVIAGTGSNSTQEAIELAKSAKDDGADAHLSITPYYNKPTQEGLYLHFKAIADAVALPMIMYNVPGRTSVNMLPETVGRLSQVANIVGIKEATGSVQQGTEALEFSKSGFALLSGDDFINLPLLSVGGVGFISVTANIAPKDLSDMYKAWVSGNTEEARRINASLMPLHRAMFFETNPIPVKAAAFKMGLIKTLEYRLPLCAMKKENEQKLTEVLKLRKMI
jgi:4-hydroxy-tetrahydrodipicolinate synthase